MTALLILGGLDTNIVATAVPSITDDFHTVADVGWYSSGFRLCTCAFQFMFGKMYKLFSVKRVFMLANAIFLVGSVLCSTATTSAMFVAGRAVTGVGFAGILGGLYTILTYILPLRRRPLFCGVLGGVESLAIIAAPIVGGALTQSLGWRWCFWINLPIGVVGATIGMLLCGSGTSTIGYYTPFMLFSSVAMPIFAGLITTFGVKTSFAQLIMYSGVSGFASGVAFNTPITAVQTVLPVEDASLGLSIVLFAQNFGPAVFIAIAQVIFMNQLATNLVRVVPNIEPSTIQDNGLTDIIKQAPAHRSMEVLEDIGKSLSETWYLAVGLTCATLIGSLLMEWRSVKKKGA
ncbi:Major facilitator superfamily domain, general substrate transporter [Penicillium griseofulvum]|uniref:Major facilitator superfamily domain, general substrate transporter n=1 Tax=Penicillium patulum TaxID=5078 RepID=A0A135LKA3_PENPA|nr:Major facilitator superfamily domain, general substrate transporter [Penicillium griseofulvum]KXG49406.1 Major facilitator superfamily domain, general substrate transporter [Penicillium griseofulvum]